MKKPSFQQLALCSLFLLANPAKAATSLGSFQNMGFESWTPTPFSIGATPAGVLSHWTVIGDVAFSKPNPLLDSYNVGGRSEVWLSSSFSGVLAGSTSLNLLGAYSMSGVTPNTFTLTANQMEAIAGVQQAGDIPIGMKSLRFAYDFSLPQVFVNETYLPVLKLGDQLAGADISGFASQNVTLTFRIGMIAGPGITEPGGKSRLDTIHFSTEPIPEPSSALLLAGAIGFLGKRRRG